MSNVTLEKISAAKAIGDAQVVKHLALVAKGQRMHPRAIAEVSGYSETTIKAWSKAAVDGALATEASIQKSADEQAVVTRTAAVTRRPTYRNRNDARINRNGYLDALQDIACAANGGGLERVLQWIRDNGGTDVDMAATFDE